MGTVDEVREKMVRQWRELPAEYCVLILHYAQQPLDSCVWNLEQFMKEIKPALDEYQPIREGSAQAATPAG